MATTKLYLDTRKAKKNGTFPLKLSICKKGVVSHLSLGIYLYDYQWVELSGKVTKHPNKAYLNNFIQRRQNEAEQFILALRDEGKMKDYDSTRIRNELKEMFDPSGSNSKDIVTLYEYIIMTGESKRMTTTKKHYASFANVYKEYEKNNETYTINDITPKWVNDFISYLREIRNLSNNSIVSYIRILKTCFNQAIDEGLTTNYPFRRINLKMNKTKNRNLTLEELRYILSFKFNNKKQIYVDAFKLQFFLIGINIFDLATLPNIITKDGRIEYYRAKTSKLYSVKVEPEAMEIIQKYSTDELLIPVMGKRKGNSQSQVASYVNHVLQSIGDDEHDMSFLTTYYSRHTWATIAHEIGIQKDVISLALGHSFGVSVTDTYINYDRDKIDEANRKVIDYVLYNKKGEGL